MHLKAAVNKHAWSKQRYNAGEVYCDSRSIIAFCVCLLTSKQKNDIFQQFYHVCQKVDKKTIKNFIISY